MNPTGSPIFSFIHASDPHFGTQTDTKFAAAPERTECFLSDLRLLRPRPRFVLLTGDLSSQGNTLPEELKTASKLLSSLPFPVHLVPGNHDFAPGPRADKPDSKLLPVTDTCWYRLFGKDSLFWVSEYPPLELVGFALRNGDPDGILDRLTDHLARPTPSVRVLIGHYPVWPVRESGSLARWGPHHIDRSATRLQSILCEHRASVALYLFGHVHVLSAQVVDGVLHASGGAIAVGAPGYRVFSVYPQGIASRFVPLSDSSLVAFRFWGGSRPEHATDSKHPTVELYHSGTALEQTFYFDFGSRELRSW